MVKVEEIRPGLVLKLQRAGLWQEPESPLGRD